MPSDYFALVGTTLDNKFRVDRLLAEGGFGVVYVGWHLALDAAVAIKILKFRGILTEEARNEFFEKFRTEAKVIARIRHPGVVQVLDTGVSQMPSGESVPWMALEFLDGETLAAMLHSDGAKHVRTPAETLAMLRPAFEALECAHDLGVAHRDVKPSNMILVQGKRGRAVRLLDFGIAKTMGEGETVGSGHTKTNTSHAAYSPKYAAPEQVSNARSGPWTDVHALGVIFTEVLTGRWPYTGKDVTDLYQDILGKERPTPRKVGFDAGPLEAVLARAVAYKPEHRYANAGEFLAALDATVPKVEKVSSLAIDPFGVTGSSDSKGEAMARSARAAMAVSFSARRSMHPSSSPENIGSDATLRPDSLRPAAYSEMQADELPRRVERTDEKMQDDTTLQSSAGSKVIAARAAASTRNRRFGAIALGASSVLAAFLVVGAKLARAPLPVTAASTAERNAVTQAQPAASRVAEAQTPDLVQVVGQVPQPRTAVAGSPSAIPEAMKPSDAGAQSLRTAIDSGALGNGTSQFQGSAGATSRTPVTNTAAHTPDVNP